MNKDLCSLLLVLFFTAAASPAAPTPAGKFHSPVGNYAVEILQKPMPKADADIDFFTLVLSKNGKPIVKAPTYGYLTSVFWSADGNYVAVNNRRGNSGDYVWVFHLPDGRLLKRPGDNSGEAWQKMADEAVAKAFPSVSGDDFIRCWVTATGWKEGQLRFVVRSIYRTDQGAFDFEATTDPTDWSITNSGISKKK
jgi:hypothetical protein